MSAQPLRSAAVFGLLAEYHDQHELLAAVQRVRGEGYTEMEAYAPMPVEEVAHAIGHKNRLPLIVLIGGIVGALAGYGLQYWASVHAYPLNVGGKPLHSWPAFIVVSFETTILFAALAAVLGMLALNGLPRPHHPVFSVPSFELASRSRFFLMILSRDPRFSLAETRALLATTSEIDVVEVPA
jgi:hypothetical protein